MASKKTTKKKRSGKKAAPKQQPLREQSVLRQFPREIWAGSAACWPC